ncbi:DUF4908 domain-containing protein [Roseibacterium beibuensis]|uniref:DUF4908 domain-containing protein n=1 Tax=[Roseibacterium] beibuensis TaxID=1193142 RepID=UPI00217D5183|nr:DUF4908 domain-containing protein [Roseibacterium beibuensis]MCS6627757.1 DUF4908 domain-containing protein [Roseibacterium beibuensis]
MAIALAAAVLSLLSFGAEALAQNRGNVQAEQSEALKNRRPTTPAPPPVGRYVAESGEGFILDRSGRHPLLRFERRDETWVLRPSAAPRGDVIYRNDAGEQVLRVTPGGGMTVYTPRAPGGSPASFSGEGRSLTPPVLGPHLLFRLMAQRSYMVSQAVGGRLVEVNLDGDQSESLCVEAMIVATEAVIRIARSPTARQYISELRSITIVEGPRAGVTYARGRLTVTVDPSEGMAGRPSSARIIRAILPTS